MASASLNPNGVPTLRPPFKKQASSFGTGHVHNMAVVVASSKVDYSVTKGGLKTWAVLLIFIFLCLTMMAIFKEDGGHDDNYDDASYDTNPFMSGIADEGHFKGAGIEDVVIADQTTKDMDDEIEDESRHQELKLFENLKKKIEKKMRGHVERKNVEKEVPSEVATDKKKDRNVEEIEKVVIEEEEEQEIPIHKEKHRRKKQKRDVEEEVEKVQKKEKHGRKKKVVIENDEEEDPEVVEHKPSHPEPKVEEIVEIVEEDANIPEEVDEVVETENEEEIEAEEPKIHRKKHRNKATLERVKRLNEEYAMKRPRKDLVKKKKSSKNRKNKRNVGEEENEEEDEDLVEEESPELPSKKEKVSLRKSGKTEESELYEIQAVKKPKSLSSYRKTYTNKRDQKFRNKLDMADFHVEKHEFDKATLLFDEVLKQYKESPRSHYGKGRMLEIKAEFENSNALIDQAMVHYQTILDDGEGTEAMVTEASESIIRCARFRGNLHKVLNIQREMIDREPDNLELQNKFGITFLMMGREEEAKKIFSAVLEEDEDNIVAQAYYGYILKVFEKDIVNGVNYMRKSLRNVDSEVNDSKFFYHLGDGLMRLNRRSEAYEIYQRGAELGLFLSTFQRSIYNIVGITSRGWWSVEQTGCTKNIKAIERQWVLIREEASELWKNYAHKFMNEDSHLTDGSHLYFPLFTNGKIIEKNCELVPRTCAIIGKNIEDHDCFEGSSKISILQAHTTVWPVCASTNTKLIAQLCLVTSSEARLRVADETKGWKNGKFLIFDESFEHELTYEGAAAGNNRIILELTLFHPEVPIEQRKNNNNEYFT